jgi:outer membrane protein OmpA-like peptidoglycan-associated protein
LLRNACEQPMILNTASNPWALRVDATCRTPGATLHVSLDGGKHWHTKHAVDSNTATLSLDVEDDQERVVLAYATKNGNAPSDVASMAFSREPPRYILHEAHASELCLRGHTSVGKRCIVCGLDANDSDDYTDGGVVVCKKCALAPLAARFGGVQAGLYEGEADPTKAACCVAVDAAAHRLWLSGPVHFEGNRDVIVDASFTLLDQLASVLKKHPSIAIRLEGHTNSKCGLQCDGSYVCANNRCAKDFGGSGGASAFSRRRAEAVARYLEGAGVSSERVHAAGLAGSRRLVDDTEGPLKHLNRRVEVHTVAF